MNTRILRLTALALFTPVVLISSGCVAVAVGAAAAGTVAYIRGNLEVTVDAPIDRVGKAADVTVRDMDFAPVSSKVDAVSGEIIARTSQDTRVQILLNKVTDKSTKISIRVGRIGDEAMSQQIYDEIKKRL